MITLLITFNLISLFITYKAWKWKSNSEWADDKMIDYIFEFEFERVMVFLWLFPFMFDIVLLFVLASIYLP